MSRRTNVCGEGASFFFGWGQRVHKIFYLNQRGPDYSCFKYMCWFPTETQKPQF